MSRLILQSTSSNAFFLSCFYFYFSFYIFFPFFFSYRLRLSGGFFYYFYLDRSQEVGWEQVSREVLRSPGKVYAWDIKWMGRGSKSERERERESTTSRLFISAQSYSFEGTEWRRDPLNLEISRLGNAMFFALFRHHRSFSLSLSLRLLSGSFTHWLLESFFPLTFCNLLHLSVCSPIGWTPSC